ncbi:MAG: hypothetical protein COA67_03150 [Lutibacter sp.]|nr:MAG: hypothetical protein COA67_03150 [Lutibacter sp.]
MNLSKEQIQFIDNYLKGQGIKFWDVRIELVDHIASKLEKSKDLILNRTYLIKEFGTRVTLEKLVDEKQKIINKKYRKLYFKEMINFFKDIKKIAIFGILILLYFFLFKHLSYKSFKITSTVLFIFPVVVYIILALKNHFLKEKSIHLERAHFYVAFSFFILNIFFQVLKPRGMFDATVNIQTTTFLMIVPLNMFFSFCGYMVYKRTYEEYSKIFKQLKSI